MWKVLIFMVAASIIGCARVPFDKCTTPNTTRCSGTVAERCEGGHWYPDLDCAVTGQVCKPPGGGSEARCRKD
jgi:hypothetical protein